MLMFFEFFRICCLFCGLCDLAAVTLICPCGIKKVPHINILYIMCLV